jgi:O-antigen ligase
MENVENHAVPTLGRRYKDRLEYYLSLAVECGVYLYVFTLWFDKGEGVRTVGLYGSLTAWLILVFVTKKIKLSTDIATYGFLAFLISTLLSSLFSIEPIYSFTALKSDILKATITFLIISTHFDIKMLFRLSRVICFSGLIILAFGLEGFLLDKEHIYTSQNIFLSADKNLYGFFVGLFLPFFILFFIKSNTRLNKGVWGLSSIWGIFGTILSASRGAIINIFAAIWVWAMFLLKREHLKKVLMVILIVILLITVSFNFWPELVKRQFLSMPKELWSFHERTYFFWKPAIEAVKKRPLFGWGYGNKIYRDQRPFENGEKPNWALTGGLHSTFITVLFHQGIAGLLSYLFLLLSTSFILFKIVKNAPDERKLLALALLSIIVGSLFLNSFVKSEPLRRIAPILGMSVALFKNMPKDWHRRTGKTGMDK